MQKLLIGLGLAVLFSCGSRTTATPSTAETKEDTYPTAVRPEFNADSAFQRVADQVNLGFRTPGSEAHTKCQQLIVAKMKQYGADTIYVQRGEATAFDGTRLPIANIFASVNPDAEKKILLIAHYDTRPWADNDPDKANHKKPVAGANDGGSGVAVMLEIARALHTARPEIGIDFFFTDVEDYGSDSDSGNGEDSWALGTQHWVASQPYSPEKRPAFGIVLDMVGGRNARFPREYASSRFAPAIVDRVWGIAASSPYADRFPNHIGGAVVDDHIYINSLGIPCIDIIETANPETGSFPPTWHTVSDNLDNIDPATLKAVGEVLLELIYSEPAK
ncbi:MAG: M28 family peptidase [Paramuribaculum sp.]|nr:M28 family peptidase [Paramuribaculum sp.]MDE6323956.1 M28 family peptidase [Paramuribaculum sp.]MDE6488033.1 M28 family peptidase [Paramuribaculum sp.]